jgi:hypothetical protein
MNDLIATDCNLLAKSFETSFGAEFRSEMGLKSLTVSGLSFLGTRVMKERFTLLRSARWK